MNWKKQVRLTVGIGMVASAGWLLVARNGELSGSELNQGLELAHTGLELITDTLAA
jgi:hypothetical protein